jgi:hypothetical protein
VPGETLGIPLGDSQDPGAGPGGNSADAIVRGVQTESLGSLALVSDGLDRAADIIFGFLPRQPSFDPGAVGNEASVLAAALRTGETFVFPLALSLLVAVFLLLQGLLDRRDAKLTRSPLNSEEDVVSFE